ncbi:MAG: hypothetical protein QM538_07335 [Methylacidiphilales bacterium]|nr:hypothetical protein [Candidatus Methylacidiphilales bacterium]
MNLTAPTPSPESLGPLLYATIVCRDLEKSVAFYRLFGTIVDYNHRLSELEFGCLFPGLNFAEQRTALVCAEHGGAIIRLVEIRDAVVSACLRNRGWLALEISTNAVDFLGEYLSYKGCKVRGAPACLEMSKDIKAMQVEGPSGEMLYITEIKNEVPPFRLPRARAVFDGLFIAVLSSKDRVASAEYYRSHGAGAPLMVETKITVVNNEFGLPLDTKHPLAVLQLFGTSLIEIDQLTSAEDMVSSLYSGIYAVSFATRAPMNDFVESVYNKPSKLLIGPDQERIILTEIDNGDDK